MLCCPSDSIASCSPVALSWVMSTPVRRRRVCIYITLCVNARLLWKARLVLSEMFSRFWLKIKTKTLKFPQMLQVSSSCNISIYIFNSICWSFLKKFFAQGPHCSHRSFMYNLVDGKHLKLLWQVFSHCFCWSDKKKKSIEPENNVKNWNSSESIWRTLLKWELL